MKLIKNNYFKKINKKKLFRNLVELGFTNLHFFNDLMYMVVDIKYIHFNLFFNNNLESKMRNFIFLHELL